MLTADGWNLKLGTRNSKLETLTPMRVLILCTGNACRSQMAEGFLHQLRPEWEVFSAGTFPADQVHPLAIRVMAEAGVDISRQPRFLRD